MSHAAILALALILDALFGEPRWLWARWPHPAVLIGRAVGWLDANLNHGPARQARGAATLAILVIGALVLGYALQGLGWMIEALIAAILLAQRSLIDHVGAVGDALRISVGDARRAVARIVGRDTAAMDRPAIARAAIESAAENFSDGVIAPAFWFLIGGLPGLLVYKIVNTADSMIGYRSDAYEDFGKAAARVDDLLNLIPSRLTAALIMAAHGLRGAWRGIAEDARLHRSPNAGWPEAAMARVLNVALAGPRSYDGQLREFAYVHENGTRTPGPAHVDAACAALWRVWAILLSLLILGALLAG